jgi:hypothetical protein
VSQSPLVTTTGNFTAAESRRSTRIEKSVPLIVLGQNRMGEPFMERTVSVTLNMHGCRYPSRHDCSVGTWVTLQVAGFISSEEKPATVRAIVRSIHSPESLRELPQVGVELETPANVWGVLPPPADWLSAGETSTSTTQLAAAPAPAQEPAAKKVGLSEIPKKPEPKMAEVANFPSPSPAASRPPAPKLAEAPQPQRVVVTPDGLIAALQGKLQQEAEKAVQAAAAKQAGEMAAQGKAEMETVRNRAEEAIQRLEKQASELRRELANAQEYVKKMARDIEPLIPARLREAVKQATADFDSATAVVMDRRHERLLENVQVVTHEALLKLNARSAEVQALAQSAVNSALEEFRREAERHANMTLTETKERAVSALSSLDADSRAACDARRQALEIEVGRCAERATEQFRKGMKTFLYSFLVADAGVEDEHSKAMLDRLLKLKDEERNLDEARGKLPARGESKIVPDADSGPLTH